MASRLDGVEADMQRLQKNQQQLETSSRTFQAHQSAVAETFKSHENSMSTLDEDVIRLKEELNRLAEAQAAQPAAGGNRAGPGANGSDSVLRSTIAGDTAKPEPSASPARDQTEIEAKEESKESVVMAEGPGDNTKPETSASPARGEPTEAELTDPERSQEAQEYIDFVEGTTAKFFRLVKEGFVNLWQWFLSLFS